MFNGISAAYEYIEYKLNIRKREGNMLTANFDSSLRTLAAENGFEPVMRIPSKGIAYMRVSPKLFSRVGYPLFLPPYSRFTNKNTNIEYYYDSDKALKIDANEYLIPLVEGSVKTQNHTATGEYVERVYIDSLDVAVNSIRVFVGDNEYTEVKSFFDNEGLYGDRQFIVKFSENPQKPIVVYIKGCSINDSITLNYRISLGELGNINYDTLFTTDAIIDNYGNEVNPDDKELVIVNKSGFNLGSNGTTKDVLRASIGYNHGQTLLYDTVSFRQFIGRYSNLMLQKILLSDSSKAINNIYLFRRQFFNIRADDVISKYREIIRRKTYLLPDVDKQNLDAAMDKNSFCLSSHNLFDGETTKYAIQILFENKNHVELYSDELEKRIYQEFSKFLYEKDFVFDAKSWFAQFMVEKNIQFEYTIFCERDEMEKLNKRKAKETQYIIKHEDTLPVLDGSFQIATADYEPVQLFFDINFAIEDTL